MPKTIDLSGKRIGSLLVIEIDKELSSNHNRRYWKCRCDCGNFKSYETSKLSGHMLRSCGCRQYEGNHKTHGKTNTRLYAIWSKMKARCSNPNTPHYECYGGRGISVCDEWNNSFESFYNWAIRSGYNDRLSIDRINSNDNYYPDNCRWATKIEQARNKRNSVMVSIEGDTKPASYYADKYNLPVRVVGERYRSLVRRGIPATHENMFYPHKHKRSKVEVLQYSLNGEFIRKWGSYSEIEQSGIGKITGVRMCCLGKWKTAYGYIWRCAE